MDYIIEDIYNDKKIFNFNYQELIQEYNYIESLNEEDFFNNIPKILHTVCFISYLKNIPSYILLCDEGLIHELIHVLDNTIEKNTFNFNKLKKMLKIIKLV